MKDNKNWLKSGLLQSSVFWGPQTQWEISDMPIERILTDYINFIL